eukprot:6209976-Pleurochrysis_carterae.AAC.1
MPSPTCLSASSACDRSDSSRSCQVRHAYPLVVSLLILMNIIFSSTPANSRLPYTAADVNGLPIAARVSHVSLEDRSSSNHPRRAV